MCRAIVFRLVPTSLEMVAVCSVLTRMFQPEVGTHIGSNCKTEDQADSTPLLTGTPRHLLRSQNTNVMVTRPCLTRTGGRHCGRHLPRVHRLHRCHDTGARHCHGVHSVPMEPQVSTHLCSVSGPRIPWGSRYEC